MRPSNILFLMVAIVFVYLLAGCVMRGYECVREEYERTQTLTHQSDSALTAFKVDLHNGAITVLPGEQGQCDITAQIIARAATVERATELAEVVKLSLKEANGSVCLEIERPKLKYETISINITATIDANASLKLSSHNGSMDVEGNLGGINARTHNGHIKLKENTGIANCCTHNGSISVSGHTGSMQFGTHNGHISIADVKEPAVKISASTHNGHIEASFATQPSAIVELSTHTGKIVCDYPVTISGAFDNHHLKGKMGSGEGKIRLSAHNGSLRIKEQN